MRQFIALTVAFISFVAVALATLISSAAAEPTNTAYVAQTTSQRSSPATAVTLFVDRDDDLDEVLSCSPTPNDCPLRQAIEQANADQAATTIRFAEDYLIQLNHALPILTEPYTTIRALPGEEVHVNGRSLSTNILRIISHDIAVEGLRLYGAGAGYSDIWIAEGAYNVTIAHNVIGDDDAPAGNCGQSPQAYGGIFINGTNDIPAKARAWIYSNIIECHGATPGDGVTLLTNKVFVGEDALGNSGPEWGNTIRENKGYGINLNKSAGNVIRHNQLHHNAQGGFYMANFNNNITDNEVD